MSEVIEIIKEGLLGSFFSVYQISIIIFPLMIFMEIAKDLNILDKFFTLFEPLTKRFSLSKESAYPLGVGILFGIMLGGGVIIQSAKEGNIDKNSLTLVCVFLICCHAIIEEPLIFAALGVNPIFLAVIRLLTAIVITILVSKILTKKMPHN